MWNTAVHSEFMHDHVDYGFQSCESKFNWRVIKEKRDAYVSRLNTIYQNNLTKVSVLGLELGEGAVLCWTVLPIWPDKNIAFARISCCFFYFFCS